MNILPHKSWHVRTKKNIARVRKDEALAAEQEKERQHKARLAESEARLKLLRKKTNSDEAQTSSYLKFSDDIQDSVTGHINFFKDGNFNSGTKSNTEYEKEKKNEREKYEKKIGYLTYLGQDTNEALGKQSWYEVVPDRSKNVNDNDNEIDLKRKSLDDPLNIVNKALKRDPISKTETSPSDKSQVKVEIKNNKHKAPKKKRRKRSTSSSSSMTDSDEDEIKKSKLQKLREERLKREQKERKRVEILFGKKDNNNDQSLFTQKYSSQFNPHLAKQNFARR